MSTLEYLRGQGAEVVFCPVDSFGRLDLGTLGRLVDAETLLVCAMLANNEIGTLQDVAAIAGIAHRHGALCLSDCVQALGKVPVNVKALGVDYATFSAHKIRKASAPSTPERGAPFAPSSTGVIKRAGSGQEPKASTTSQASGRRAPGPTGFWPGRPRSGNFETAWRPDFAP